MKRQLTKIFLRVGLSGGVLLPPTRNVGGVNLTTFETDFGTANVMLDRYMPADTIVAVSLEELAPVILEIPNKGFLFWEPLAKTGARDTSQIYGEIGLKYGNQRKHAKIINASSSYNLSDGGATGSGAVLGS